MPRLPLEVLKRRVARAKQLGLEYPQYASILLGTGRDIVGFLFTCSALGLRLEKSIALPDSVAAKLTNLEQCDRMFLGPQGRDPRALARALAHSAQITFASAAPAPAEPATWDAGRTAIRAALDPLKLPSDKVVMIGTRAEERAWADAANLARFLPAEHYFPR